MNHVVGLQLQQIRTQYEAQITELRRQEDEFKQLREAYAAKQRELAARPEPVVQEPQVQPDLVPLIRQIATEVAQAVVLDQMRASVNTMPTPQQPWNPNPAAPLYYNPFAGRRW